MMTTTVEQQAGSAAVPKPLAPPRHSHRRRRPVDRPRRQLLPCLNGPSSGDPAQNAQKSTEPDPADDRPWLSAQDLKNPGDYYKYQWGGVRRERGGCAYAAHDHLGQLIAVFPAECVVVRFGKTESSVDSWDELALAIAGRLT
jgi:hypothetical protein